MKRIIVLIAAMGIGAWLGAPQKASAGTQDFKLVNMTGVDIHNLHVSESNKDSWEEDVLGESVLADGESLDVSFSGKSACSWDMMVKNEAGDSLYWRKIDLCKVESVTLKCSKAKGCWAEFN